MYHDTNERFLTLKEVQYKTGLGRTTVYKMIKEGDFPAQIQVGPRAVRWLQTEVDRWMFSRVEGR
jgi:prophage regulatory protein